MKSKNFQFNPKKRRGLSSVVGALLFVVLMVATFSVLGVALNTQTEIVDTSRSVADMGLKKQQEKFIINNVVQPIGSTLQIHATNKHPTNPTEIFTLVMTNSSDISNGFPTTTIDIPSETSFLPPSTDDTTDIVETLNLKMKTPPSGTDLYQFKVISSLGNVEKFNLVCDSSGLCGQSIGGGGGTGDLAVQLFLDGPNGVNTKISTVIMFVSNIGDGDLKEIWPDTSCATIPGFPTITPSGGDFTGCITTPAIDADPDCGDGLSGVCMVPGQTMIFKFDGTVLGDVGDEFSFCNSVSGKQLDDTGVSSNTDCDSLTVIDPNDCGGCDAGGEGGETIIIIDDLLIKPSLFLTIPSPFGSVSSGGANDDLGIWGVQVANPLNFTISVSKVTITAFAPGANSNTRIFDKGDDNVNISPNYSGVPLDLASWNIADENVLVWKNFTNPIVLGPYQSDSFVLKMNPFSNSVDLEAIIVQTSIFSTAGSFGKAGYQTTQYKSGGSNDAPIVNVYLSRVVDSTDNADIFGHLNNVKNGTSQEFIIIMADGDKDGGSYIEAGAELIINVPREWGYPEINLAKTNKFIENPTQPQIINHTDGSYQIIGLLDERIGDIDNAYETATLTFSSASPEKISERLYIMHILGNGLTNVSDLAIGPLTEIVIHVIGNVTGYP